jgi:glycogen operon protein
VKGDDGAVPQLACRLIASPDLYGSRERGPEKSVNFVTCHDGFTLNDLVSYNKKHNQANREGNRDGSDYNGSWNCGAEGATADPAIEALRNRQVKNFLTLMMAAMGTPMLLMGDEFRRTQHGNNNAYCQNNQIGWVDWSGLERHRDIHRFVQLLIRARRSQLSPEAPDMTLSQVLANSQIQWHGVKLNQPDWAHHSHCIALTSLSRRNNLAIHLMANAYWEGMEFELPVPDSPWFSGWRRWIDTARPSPEDILAQASQVPVTESAYLVQPRSLVLLVSDAGPV